MRFYLKCGFAACELVRVSMTNLRPKLGNMVDITKNPIIFYKYTGNTTHTKEELKAESFLNSTPASEDYVSAQQVRDNSI